MPKRNLPSAVIQARTGIITQHTARYAGKVVNKMLSLFSVFQCNARLKKPTIHAEIVANSHTVRLPPRAATNNETSK
jgi:hypothetical protein